MTGDEETVDVPADWYSAVHPRRDGRLLVGRPAPLDQPNVPVQAWSAQIERAGGFDGILDSPSSDPALRQLVRSDPKSFGAESVRFAIDQYIAMPPPTQEHLIDDTIARLGLPMTTAVCVASAGAAIVQATGFSCAIVRRTAADDLDPTSELPYSWGFSGLRRLRSYLAATDDAAHEQTVVLLEPLRDGLFYRRLLTSYLLPDRRDWVDADIADLPADYRGPGFLLLYSASRPAQLRDQWAHAKDAFVTVWDALGPAAAPLLLRSFDRCYVADRPARAAALDVLSRIPADAALDGLLARADLPDVAPAIEAAARRFPRRAARMLRGRAHQNYMDTLLLRLLKDHPELATDPGVGDHYEVTVPPDLPALLTSPPWTRPRPRRIPVPDVPQPPATIVWQPGERERWTFTWPAQGDAAWAEHLRTHGADAWFYLHGPEEQVRPLLADWAVEDTSFYPYDPRPLAARFELAVLPALLRLATRKPALGARALLPYRSVDVARLMGRWLARSRQFRPLAEQWFERHEVAATTLLLPDALRGNEFDRSTATIALSRLDPELVRRAGMEQGWAGQVETMLSSDPLDLVPTRVPPVPAWLDVALLPPVLMADGRSRLPGSAVATLCRMIAMSDLADPYPGLAAIGERCDRASLARFVWALFSNWTVAGRPAAGVWAMNSLAYYGDDTIADELTGMVLRWPSQGAAARAKRGVDVLATMDCPAALRQLGMISRTAKSTPVRNHATAALDRAAMQRGLLPEQLDDLLAPDLGLDGPPITYRGTEFRLVLTGGPALGLRSSDGSLITTLPPPQNDDDRAVAADWKRRRTRAGPTIRDQVRRLEEAMVAQRPWTATDFTTLVAHPLLGRLARRLVWQADDRTGVVDALGDLVDVGGGLVPDPERIRLAHPAATDLACWRTWRREQGIDQPFPQIDRPVHDGDPSSQWGRTVSTASLYSLIGRGWRWGPTARAAGRDLVLRAVPGQGMVELQIDPGVSAVLDPADQPAQTIVSVRFDSYRHDEFGVFGDLHPVTRSELMSDLLGLS